MDIKKLQANLLKKYCELHDHLLEEYESLNDEQKTDFLNKMELIRKELDLIGIGFQFKQLLEQQQSSIIVPQMNIKK